MDIEHIRKRLQGKDLRAVAAKTGVSVRTLRRFRNQGSSISLANALKLRGRW